MQIQFPWGRLDEKTLEFFASWMATDWHRSDSSCFSRSSSLTGCCHWGGGPPPISSIGGAVPSPPLGGGLHSCLIPYTKQDVCLVYGYIGLAAKRQPWHQHTFKEGTFLHWGNCKHCQYHGSPSHKLYHLISPQNAHRYNLRFSGQNDLIINTGQFGVMDQHPGSEWELFSTWNPFSISYTGCMCSTFKDTVQCNI